MNKGTLNMVYVNVRVLFLPYLEYDSPYINVEFHDRYDIRRQNV